MDLLNLGGGPGSRTQDSACGPELFLSYHRAPTSPLKTKEIWRGHLVSLLVPQWDPAQLPHLIWTPGCLWWVSRAGDFKSRWALLWLWTYLSGPSSATQWNMLRTPSCSGVSSGRLLRSNGSELRVRLGCLSGYRHSRSSLCKHQAPHQPLRGTSIMWVRGIAMALGRLWPAGTNHLLRGSWVQGSSGWSQG